LNWLIEPPLEQLGKTFGIFHLSTALGPLFFSTTTGLLYDKQADKQHDCLGFHCYQTTYLIGTIGSLVNILSILCLIAFKRKSKKQSTAVLELED